MSAPDKVITHGTGPVLAGWRFHRSVNGPDEVEFTAHNCPAIDTYSPGNVVPGYSRLYVVNTTPTLVPGSQWDIMVRARGLISGSSRVIAKNLATDTLGWDTLRERRMELKSAAVPQFGSTHPEHGLMFFMSSGTEEMLDLGNGNSNWVIRERNYKGSATGAYKRIHRKITTNASVTSNDSIVVYLAGGWSTGQKANISFPRIVVEDTIITTAAPPTQLVPGNYVPPDPPSVTVIPITDNIAIYNWPSGWTLNAINDDELFFGAGLHLQTITYEYVPFKTM